MRRSARIGLVRLRFVYLLITRLCVTAGLSQRDAAWRNAEILLLRHQLSVAQRQLGEHSGPTGP
jgi:hypothetical protein